jgi:hypothetical protein
MRALLITLAVLVATCLAELFKAPANADGLDAGAISAPEFPLQAPNNPTHTHTPTRVPPLVALVSRCACLCRVSVFGNDRDGGAPAGQKH